MDNFCKSTASIWYLVGTVINIFKIVIPIIIVLLAILDLGKAVMAGEEKEIKEAQKMLIKRIIYGVVIFFVVTLVQGVFSLVSSQFQNDKTNACWICATNPNSGECTKHLGDSDIPYNGSDANNGNNSGANR